MPNKKKTENDSSTELDFEQQPTTETDAQVSDVQVSEAKRQFAWFQNAVIAAICLGCAIALSLNLVDPDSWGHVLYGHELLEDGSLPRTATHTYSAVDHPWINHENLAEIVMAVGYKYVGIVGLLVAKCLLGMAILTTMVIVARWHAVGLMLAWCFMLLIATNLTAFFPLRPQLLSFLWCSAMLVILDRAFAKWHRREIDYRWLWGVLPIFALWANSHGGFVAGIGIFTAVLIGRSIELLVRKGINKPTLQVVGHLALIACMAGLVTLLNPYGLRLPLWLVASLGSPRPEITEWAAPSFGDPVIMPFILLASIALIAMLRGRRRVDWTQLCVLALVGFQASMHLRHIAFFTLLCGFWLPPYIARIVARLRNRDANHPKHDIVLSHRMRTAFAVVMLAVMLLQGTALSKRLASFPVYKSSYPVDAIDFMVKRHISGKLVVSFNWAQYAIAALSPNVTVQFDGRFRTCYPQEQVDRHFDFLIGEYGGHRYRSEASGKIDGSRVLSEGEPDLILLDRKYKHATAVMDSATESPSSPWVLLYQDGVAQLWGKKTRFDNPRTKNYVPPIFRSISDRWSPSAVQWPAIPKRS